MPLRANHGGNLRRQFLDKQLISTGVNNATGLTGKEKENIKKWVSRYRRNIDIYVEEVFGIKLYPIQKIMIHMLGISDLFWGLCTRGAAKSFIVAIYALAVFTLYPYSEIVITSSTISQASKLVEKKMRDEVIKKLSPYLLYMFQKEYIVITKSNTNDGGAYTVENKLNGSTIKVMPCLESSRGERSTLNIYEEARILKASILQSVFEPMGHTRPAKYLLKKEYQTRRWLEKAKTIYISSCRFTYEWFWRSYQDCVQNYYISNHEVYIPFAEDIFAAIDDGSRTWADYRKNKKSMAEMDFRCEILNEMLGADDDAFFDLKPFKENQIIKQSFKPPTNMDVFLGNDLGNKPKEDMEIRLVIADFAFSNTTSREKNDNTILMCMSLHWKKNRFERHVDYMEGWPASDSLGAGLRVKELRQDYDADYCIVDGRSGGESVYNYMTMPQDNPERGALWDGRGLTECADKSLQIAQDNKVADLQARAVDKDAIPCIISIFGTSELNSSCWVELKRQLESNNIKFLVSTEQAQEALEDSGEYFTLTTEQLADRLVPYGQVDLMIQEAIQLKAEIRNNKIRMVEGRSQTKDRIVVLAYGNYIASKIENQWSKYGQEEDEDIEDIQLVY